MRLAPIILATSTLVGCSDGIAPSAAPTMPVAPTPVEGTPSAWIVAMVTEDDGSGLCIQGATVQVVAGQALGRSETQTLPCDVWDFGGITLDKLVPGVEMTLRASASGYLAQEKVVIPHSGPQSTLIFTLSSSR
jgi:hypothetical protein